MDDNGVYEIEVETNVGEEEIYINKKTEYHSGKGI